jgi:hypothetical protein
MRLRLLLIIQLLKKLNAQLDELNIEYIIVKLQRKK